MSIWVSLFKVVAHEVVGAMCREGVKMGGDRIRGFAKGERTSPKTGKHRNNFGKTQGQYDAMKKGKIGRPPGSKNKK